MNLILADERFYPEIEMLYTLNLPTESEWKLVLECNYHELLPDLAENEKLYKANF